MSGDERGVEIVGPFNEYRLVVDGWQVPFVEAIEAVGGRIHFVVDHRLGFDVSAADFDQVARLVANVFAVAAGMASWPEGDLTDAERERRFRHLTHRALQPIRLHGITTVATEEIDPQPSDDPRDEEQRA